MADLKIRVFKGTADQPETTVTIPGGVLKVASRLIPGLIPGKAAAALQDKGIDIAEIVELSRNPDVRGPLVEIEDHHKNERVVVSLE